MFKHIKTEIVRPFAKTDHDESGHYYITNEGKRYPSITTVLKLLDTKEWYGYWVTSIAKKENISETDAKVRCKQIGEESIDVGNVLHEMMEHHAHNQMGVLAVDPVRYGVDINHLATNLSDHLTSHVDNIYGTEKEIYSDDLELAGTADCIAEYDGVPSIIDYKNSRKPKSKSQCASKDYFIQLCAYAKMWEFCTGQKIEQGVILVASWDYKIKAHIVKLADYEADFMKKLVLIEQQQALNTM